MPSSYEFWLLNDHGQRITLLSNPVYFSYSRAVRGYGTLLIAFPYEEFSHLITPVFVPDWRIDVWRSPEFGYPLRHEEVYLLRMHKIYTRETDNVQLIAFYGRDAKDLLRRRYIIQPAGYPQTYKTGYIDDIMKELVREQMLYGSALDENAVVDNTRAFPAGEFLVEGNKSLGPQHTITCSDRNVLDILKDLQEASFQKHREDIANSRIFFDLVPFDVQGVTAYILGEADSLAILDELGDELWDESAAETSAEQGFQFVIFADLRGQDRTSNALFFSVENGNLEAPYYTLDRLDEMNSVVVKGYGRGDSRPSARVTDTQQSTLSRWNMCEIVEDASTEPAQTSLEDYAYPVLYANAPKEEIGAVFLNTPGGEDAPRSLYGVDWDLGDLLPVEYADKHFNVEVGIVYIAIDENGRETISGRNNVEASS